MVTSSSAGRPARSLLRVQLSRDEADAVRSALEVARRLLGADQPSWDDVHDLDAAATALERGAERVRDALRTGRHADEVLADGALSALAADLDESRRLLDRAALRHRQESLQRAHEALEGLRFVHGEEGLARAGALAAVRFGFDRALVSRVAEGSWRVVAAADAVEDVLLPPVAARAFPEAVDDDGDAVVLDPEHLVVSEQRARLVDVDAAAAVPRPDQHPLLALAPRCSVYVVAPVVVGGQVRGLLHADLHRHAGGPAPSDLLVLDVIAQGLGLALERVVAEAALDRLRVGVEQLGRRLGSPRSPAPAARRAVGDPPLTPRESEVLALLAQGRTTKQVAAALTIGEQTVKSHVAQVLRKTGSANRAEAVAAWHAHTQEDA